VRAAETPLAVFAPVLGARSETFIRRHMQDLLAGKTAVVAESCDPPHGGAWTVPAPTLVLNRIHSGGVPRLLLDGARRRLSGKTWAEMTDDTVRAFLREHRVRAIIGEFLSWSLRWVDVADSLGIPIFGHAHGCDVSADLRDPRWRAGYLRYNDSGGVIAMSKASARRLTGLGLDPRKVHVIPYGVDVPLHPPTRPNDRLIHCVAVGRMVSKKAPILLLDAFRRAAEVCPELRLDYAGGGELLPAAEQFVHAFGLAERVRLHGPQPSDAVHDLLGKADLFLQHSIVDPATGDEEGLPVSILEAMAQGLPVISTRHAGIPEAVAEGETGFLVAEGDTRAMADRIVRLAGRPELRRDMGVGAWIRARELFSWERERASLLDLVGLRCA